MSNVFNNTYLEGWGLVPSAKGLDFLEKKEGIVQERKSEKNESKTTN